MFGEGGKRGREERGEGEEGPFFYLSEGEADEVESRRYDRYEGRYDTRVGTRIGTRAPIRQRKKPTVSKYPR